MVKALKPETTEGLFPEKIGNNEIKNEIAESKKWEERIKRKDLTCKANKCQYDFQQYETI